MFKVGNKVKVKDTLEHKTYYINGVTYYTNSNMMHFRGKCYTIAEVNYEKPHCYRLVGDDNEYYWHESWLTKIDVPTLNIF